MSVSSQDIVNQALQYIGDNQPPVTGQAPTFDTSTAGKAAAQLYTPCVATVTRQWAWDFARKESALALSGNAAPAGWSFEYLYPSDCVQIWQLTPNMIIDPNNPLPINWNVGNSIVGLAQVKVIWANLVDALAIYAATPPEATWDAGFRESVVRLLASELAMAIAGKPDTGQGLLESGGAMETIAEGRPD